MKLKQMPIESFKTQPTKYDIIDMEVAKLLHRNCNLVFYIDEHYRLMATSQKRLEETILTGMGGMENILENELESFCLKLPEYSRYIVDAWRWVADREETGFSEVRRLSFMGGWEVVFVKSDTPPVKVQADTAPMAICRAFLKFNGVDVEELLNENKEVIT